MFLDTLPNETLRLTSRQVLKVTWFVFRSCKIRLLGFRALMFVLFPFRYHYVHAVGPEKVFMKKMAAMRGGMDVMFFAFLRHFLICSWHKNRRRKERKTPWNTSNFFVKVSAQVCSDINRVSLPVWVLSERLQIQILRLFCLISIITTNC